MGQDLIAGFESGSCSADLAYGAGRLHAESHRRRDSDIPATGANEVIPVGDAGCVNLHQYLVRLQARQLRQVNKLDPASNLKDPRPFHPEPSSSDISNR